MSKLQFSFIALIFLLNSCAKSPQKNSSVEPVFTYEKTACMGACPVYIFSLYENGKATYNGIRNVENIGNFEKKLSDAEYKSFMELLTSAKLAQYEDSYRGNVTDLPTTKIYFINNGEAKKILDYYGAPETLKESEKAIEVLINSISWQ